MNHYKIALACLVALFVSTPAMAKGNCAPSSSQANPAQVQNCLDRMNNPSQVREHQQQEKRDHCEQNAKNRKLQGNARSSFMSSCMNANEAVQKHATVAKDHVDTQPPAQAAATMRRAQSHTAAKRHTESRNSCVAQANKRHLKGSKRRHFLKNCH